jgi:NADP-dependent 3-hydroxy acid dehydrogenase YdfG
MSDRLVWITGAGSGIGRAIAVAFAQDGARVALSGRRAAALDETVALIGERAKAFPGDLSEAAEVQRVHAAVVAEYGKIDILVNNAGGNAKRRHWHQLSVADMAAVLDVNLKTPFMCSLAVLPGMRARRAGTLIHIASVAGTTQFPISGPAYTASKTGLRAMSGSISAEEGIHGIRSICINPGEVETDILATRPNPPSADDRARMMQPEDIAATAVFAASLPPRASIVDMTVVPTDNGFWRGIAETIARG